MNKKGFVFIETIVVVVVLLTSLLYLYSTYTALSINEKKRITYDDVAYLYRTYSIKKYFVSQRLDRLASNMDQTVPSKFMVSFGCKSRDLFDSYTKEAGFCESALEDLNVKNVYFTYYDLSFLHDCDNNSIDGMCSVLSMVDTSVGDYMKTLGGKGESGYRIIVEFEDDGKGNKCEDEKHCLQYFGTIKVGENL